MYSRKCLRTFANVGVGEYATTQCVGDANAALVRLVVGVYYWHGQGHGARIRESPQEGSPRGMVLGCYGGG